ncbi:MAG: hypothetical protein AAFX03_03535 [Pseudomonadota bacterium]
MDHTELKTRFLAAVETPPDLGAIRSLGRRLADAGRKAQAGDRLDLAAALAHTAFLAPDRTAEVYDALAEGWRGEAVQAEPIAPLDGPPEPAPPGLWDAHWAVVEDAIAGELDALSITQRTAASARSWARALSPASPRCRIATPA